MNVLMQWETEIGREVDRERCGRRLWAVSSQSVPWGHGAWVSRQRVGGKESLPSVLSA